MAEKRIGTTTNYRMFKSVCGNREINVSSKLIDSIKMYGQISPIVVNDKYEVLDGQHRLEALKQLGLPVNYVVHSGGDIESIISCNNVSKSWAIKDYVKSYSDRGNESYNYLLTLIKRYENQLPVSSVVDTIGVRLKTNAFRKLKKGDIDLTFKDYIESMKELDYILNAINIGGITTKRGFINALSFFYNNPRIDNDRMMNVIAKYKLKSFSNGTEWVKELEELYNKHLSNKVYVMEEWAKKGKNRYGREKNVFDENL